MPIFATVFRSIAFSCLFCCSRGENLLPSNHFFRSSTPIISYATTTRISPPSSSTYSPNPSASCYHLETLSTTITRRMLNARQHTQQFQIAIPIAMDQPEALHPTKACARVQRLRRGYKFALDRPTMPTVPPYYHQNRKFNRRKISRTQTVCQPRAHSLLLGQSINAMYLKRQRSWAYPER